MYIDVYTCIDKAIYISMFIHNCIYMFIFTQASTCKRNVVSALAASRANYILMRHISHNCRPGCANMLVMCQQFLPSQRLQAVYRLRLAHCMIV